MYMAKHTENISLCFSNFCERQ